MAKFSIDKKGYNIEEVDDYFRKMYIKYENKLAEQKDRLVSMKLELDNANAMLKTYKGKDEQISKALIYAVEKSEQIEEQAKSIFNNEVKRLNMLYVRWEDLLIEVEKQCELSGVNTYLRKVTADFKKSIEDVSKKDLIFNNQSIKDDLKNNSNQFVRNILNKMDYIVNASPVDAIVNSKSKKVVSEAEQIIGIELNDRPVKKETVSNDLEVKINKDAKYDSKSYSKISNINDRLKKLNLINNVSAAELKKGESFADKFLNSSDRGNSVLSKNIAKRKPQTTSNPFNYGEYPKPNETGFDLKEAVSAKENLDDIMKVFDFFDDGDNNKK